MEAADLPSWRDVYENALCCMVIATPLGLELTPGRMVDGRFVDWGRVVLAVEQGVEEIGSRLQELFRSNGDAEATGEAD